MLVFLAADPREFRGLLTHCEEVKTTDLPGRLPVHWARTGTLRGRKTLAIANGAGANRALRGVEAAWSSGPVEVVCNIGFCGALEENLGIGDVFVATSVCSGARELPARKPVAKAEYASGKLASIDHVAQTAVEKARLRQTGAKAVEMEAWGAAVKAAEYGVPFYCVRAVSDLAGETFACDFNAALREDGRFDTMRLLVSAMRHPFSRFPELLRLRRRCDVASKNLGDFLAGCQF